MERTQHSQTAAPLTDEARIQLLAIAARLTERRPSASIDDARRHALALTYATDAKGFCTPAADALERELLAHMPALPRGTSVTRGEYALQLRAAAA